MGSTVHGAASEPRGGSRPLEDRHLGSRYAATLATWLKASRLASQSYIALPLLLGQLLASHETGAPLHVPTFVLVHLFGLFDQLYIVYANDVADAETDRKNATPTIFSGGSRVLVQGALSAQTLTRAAFACAFAMIAVSFALSIARDAPLLSLLAVIAVGLLWAYSYPPIRLSYRGGGALLQAAGVGVVLPLYGFVAQGGADVPWSALAALVPAQLACAIATSLPDEPSDRASDKRTFAVRVGGERAAQVAAALLLVSSVLTVVVLDASGYTSLLVIPFGLALAVFFVRPAEPGTHALVVRVALAVASSLALVAIMALAVAS